MDRLKTYNYFVKSSTLKVDHYTLCRVIKIHTACLFSVE